MNLIEVALYWGSYDFYATSVDFVLPELEEFREVLCEYAIAERPLTIALPPRHKREARQRVAWLSRPPHAGHEEYG